MSTNGTNGAPTAAERRQRRDRRSAERHDDDRKLLTTTGTEARRDSFGPGGGVGMPTERTENFGVALRLGEHARQGDPAAVVVVVVTVASVVLVVLGPRLLGQATDIIVSGVSATGIDFGALHRKLFIVGAIYVAAWVLAYTQAYILAGVVQRSMFGLRE